MNDFEGLLSSDYGFKPSGKSAPMSNVKSSTKTTSFTTSSSSFDRNSDFSDLGNFDNVFANSKSTSGARNVSGVDFDSIFGGGGGGESAATVAPQSKFSSLPVFDKPVYDDDDVSSSPVNRFDDIFGSKTSGGGGGGGGDVFDDLLGGIGAKKKENSSVKSNSKGRVSEVSSFDDLLPGFGGGSSMDRSPPRTTKKSSSVLDDPFVVLESTSHQVPSSSGVFSDPLDEIGLNKSGSKNFENNASGGDFDDINPLAGFAQSVPPFAAQTNRREKDESPLRTGSRVSGRQTSAGAERGQKSSVTSPERRVPVDDFGDSVHSIPEMPSVSTETSRSVPNASSPVHNNSFRESYSHGDVSPPPEEKMGSSDEVWLTVSEIPLFTQPTAAPPPSRPPPPRHGQFSRSDSSSFPPSNAQSKVNEYSSFPGSNPYLQTPKSAPAEATGSFASPLDELEEFAAGRNQSSVDSNSDFHSGEDFYPNSAAAASAAAMKEAMDRAEAKFRYARGVRERENAKVSRGRENVSVEKEEKAGEDSQDREFREGQERLMRDRQQREVDEEEKRQREEEDRRRIEKEREEKERERRRVERERELARQAVERATREARERAAIEARTRAERAAVQKANSEARERAERAAVQRAQAEARERAAAMAKERAEKAAAEAREKEKAQQDKEARERAAASRTAQQKNEPDFDSIFGMGSRASSAPRPRATSSSDPFETQFQSKPAPEATRSSVNSTSGIRKASSSTSIVDDLSSIFGAPPSSVNSQHIDGETEERRRARLEREQRTQQRAEKAVAEKNARDLQVQREQAERHRISETLDVEIKRWAAGKEGNLRALLSTLQYVLWPECGWQPVSLTDLITGASVKKVYRKATLCIHPDKVQQKGANLQQKYVAEKVFDLLKEAWNKFNSEELF